MAIIDKGPRCVCGHTANGHRMRTDESCFCRLNNARVECACDRFKRLSG